MSFGQFSEKPLPPEKKECLRCGELMPASAARCWLCLERFPNQPETANSNGQRRSADRMNGTGSQDHLFLVLLGLLGVLLFFALASEAPGLLILVFIIALPAAIGHFRNKRERRAQITSTAQYSDSARGGEVPDIRVRHPRDENALDLLAGFFSAVGTAIVIGVTFFLTFFVTCIASLMGSGAVIEWTGLSGDWMLLLVFGSVGVGVAAGAYVTVRLANGLTGGRKAK